MREVSRSGSVEVPESDQLEERCPLLAQRLIFG
jgi:hypothetical protein